MKIVAAADLHITTARPVNRVDDYVETILGKIDQIIHLTRKNKAVLALAGDIVDTTKMSKVSYELINKVIQIIRLSQTRVFACHGQHDIAYHNQNLQVSPYYTLFVSGALEMPAHLGIVVENTRFYGAGWGQKIPIPQEKIKGVSDVLLLHRTITPGEPPFYLKDATPAQEVMKALPMYDYFICGDYHVPFWNKSKAGQILVNCGPMLRQKINERDLKPRIHLIDTDTGTVTPFFLKIQEQVWNDARLEKQKEHEVTIETDGLLEVMTRQNDRPDFLKILNKTLTETKDARLVEMVQDILTEAKKRLEA